MHDPIRVLVLGTGQMGSRSDMAIQATCSTVEDAGDEITAGTRP